MFNVGVELGQLTVILLAYFLLTFAYLLFTYLNDVMLLFLIMVA